MLQNVVLRRIYEGRMGDLTGGFTVFLLARYY
jgi:hypothetical protein